MALVMDHFCASFLRTLFGVVKDLAGQFVDEGMTDLLLARLIWEFAVAVLAHLIVNECLLALGVHLHDQYQVEADLTDECRLWVFLDKRCLCRTCRSFSSPFQATIRIVVALDGSRLCINGDGDHSDDKKQSLHC